MASKTRLPLDVVAAGRLPDRILEDIGKVAISVEEVAAWEQSKPNFSFTLTDRKMSFTVRNSVRWEKPWGAVVAGIVTSLGVIWWSFVHYVLPHMT